MPHSDYFKLCRLAILTSVVHGPQDSLQFYQRIHRLKLFSFYNLFLHDYIAKFCRGYIRDDITLVANGMNDYVFVFHFVLRRF